MQSGRRDALWRRVESTIVCAHTERGPSDDEWSGFLTCLAEIRDPSAARVLVHTDGGAPNAHQRALLKAQCGSVSPPIAVLTPSSGARAIATAISWFIPTIRVFRPEDINGALRHLGVSASRVALLRRTLAELRTDLRWLPDEHASVR
jgi:hypothetical protein